MQENNNGLNIDLKYLESILDLAIANDPSLVVGKLPVEKNFNYINQSSAQSQSSDNNVNVLALAIRPEKHPLLKSIGMTFKVAFSTLAASFAKLFA